MPEALGGRSTTGSRSPRLALLVLLSLLVPAPPPTPVPPSGSLSPFPTTLHTPSPAAAEPILQGRGALLEDAHGGPILYAKARLESRPVASLTKVMTAMVVIEHLQPDATVTVGADATRATGAELGLRSGERRTVRELLDALLLSSADDAAVALADAVSGSGGVPVFVGLMNRRAAALGLRGTHFVDPTGLDERDRSSPQDLGVLARSAMSLPLFRSIVATKLRDVPAPSGPPRHLQNRNALLWLYDGAVGVKTGFTTPAGHCLLAAATRGPRTLIAVVLGDATGQASFDDAARLLNYGFAAFLPPIPVPSPPPRPTRPPPAPLADPLDSLAGILRVMARGLFGPFL